MRFVFVLLLSGCAATPSFEYKEICASVEIIDYDLRKPSGGDAYALAWIGGECCRIQIERKHYRNETIGHEFRHCLDGYWHK